MSAAVSPSEKPCFLRRLVERLTFSWSDLHGVGTSKAVNSALIWVIVIPFLARVVNEVEVRTGSRLSLPFNFLMLYFAAFCFTVASALFAFFCPKLAKLAPNYGAFVIGNHSELELKNWFREIAGSKQSKGEADPGLIRQFLSELGRASNARAAEVVEIFSGKAGHAIMDPFWATPAGDRLPNAFDFALKTANQRQPVVRFVASLFYGLGFLCLAAIIIYNFRSIYEYLRGHPLW
jgi:hypothetical protein